MFKTLWCHNIQNYFCLTPQPFCRQIKNFIDGGALQGAWKNSSLDDVCSEDGLLPAHNLNTVVEIKYKNRYLLQSLTGQKLAFLWNLPRQVVHLVTLSGNLPAVPVAIPVLLKSFTSTTVTTNRRFSFPYTTHSFSKG